MQKTEASIQSKKWNMDFDYYVNSNEYIIIPVLKKQIFIQLMFADLCKNGSKLSSCSWGFKKKECNSSYRILFTPNNIT